MFSTRHRHVLDRRRVLAAVLLIVAFSASHRPAHAGDAPGWLGVEPQAMTHELAKAFGLRHTQGVVVTEVIPGSPAERANVHVGDVLIKFADRDVTSPEGLKEQIKATTPGKRVRIEVVRFRGKVRLLVARIEAHVSARPASHIRTNPRFERLGVQLTDLTLAERIRYGTGLHGVLVKAAGPGTPSLQSGDVILRVADEPVSSVQALIDRIGKEKPGWALPVLVQRGQKRFYVPLTIPDD